MKLRLTDPDIDQFGHVTVAEFDGWIVKIVSLLANDRITLYPANEPYMPAYGWCYPKGLAAWIAARAWDPDTEGEPAGHVKATLPLRRQAGETASDYQEAMRKRILRLL